MYFTSANVLQVFACKLFVAFSDIYVESLFFPSIHLPQLIWKWVTGARASAGKPEPPSP